MTEPATLPVQVEITAVIPGVADSSYEVTELESAENAARMAFGTSTEVEGNGIGGWLIYLPTNHPFVVVLERQGYNSTRASNFTIEAEMP